MADETASVTPLIVGTSRRRMTAVQRKTLIVDSAAVLFDQHGYGATTMEDIARDLGIAKPTLYHYFASKDEILYAIHEEFIDLLLARADARVDSSPLSPVVLLLEVMVDILEVMETRRGHVRVFFEHHRELPQAHREELVVNRDRYEAMVTDLFVVAMHSGELRRSDPRLAALAMFGMCNWTYQWFSPDKGMRGRDVAYTFWTYLVQGLGAAPNPVD